MYHQQTKQHKTINIPIQRVGSDNRSSQMPQYHQHPQSIQQPHGGHYPQYPAYHQQPQQQQPPQQTYQSYQYQQPNNLPYPSNFTASQPNTHSHMNYPPNKNVPNSPVVKEIPIQRESHPAPMSNPTVDSNSTRLEPQNEREMRKSPSPLPLSPMDKVNKITDVVKNLMLKVDVFNGEKSDKEYLYLEEMLTRQLIELDNIDSEGDDTIRACRKSAVQMVQNSIDRLEKKCSRTNDAPEENKNATS